MLRFFAMAKVQHYMGLNTNLDNLYSSIKQVLQTQKELRMSLRSWPYHGRASQSGTWYPHV